MLDNLRQVGFRGAIYPVNPHYEQVGGLLCYATVGDIPAEVEAAAIALPAGAAVETVRQCSRNMRYDFAAALEVNSHDLLRTPIRKPQAIAMPARRFAESQIRQQDSNIRFRSWVRVHHVLLYAAGW